MKLLKLAMSAFGPYAGKLELDFVKGLGDARFFLIHGATGAGKTSILDAICFALYGSSSGGERESSMFRAEQAAPSQETEVSFTFSLGDRTYRVCRSPAYERAKTRGEGTTKQQAKAALYRIREDGEELVESGAGKVTDHIEELLGFRSEQFRQVVLLPQGAFKKFLMADSIARQGILDVLFKTGIYRRIEELLKERTKALEEQVKSQQQFRKLLLQQAEAEGEEELSHRLEELQERLRAAEQEAVTREQQHKAALEALQQGKKLAEAFQARTKAEEVLAQDQEKLKLAGERKRQLEQADRAAGLMDKESAANQRTEERKQRAAAEQEAVQRLEELNAKLKAAKEEYERRQGEEGLRKDTESRIQKLTGYLEISRELQKYRKTAESAGEEARKARAEAEKLQADWEAVQKKGQEYLESEQKAVAAAGQEQAVLMSIEQAKRKAEVRSKLDDLEQQLRDWEQKHQRMQSEVQRRTEAAEAQKVTWERLRHLAQEGSAAFLAGDLKEGEPCPVCGSVHHPSPAVSDAVLPSPEELEAAEKKFGELDALRNQEEEKLASVRDAWGKATAERKLLQDRWDEEFSGAETEPLPKLQAQLEEIRRASESLKEIRRLQEQNRSKEAALAGQKESARERAGELAEKAAGLKGIWEEKQQQLPAEYQEEEKLQKELEAAKGKKAELERLWQQAQDAFHRTEKEQAAQKTKTEDAQRACREAEQREKEARGVFLEAVRNAGIASVEEFQKILSGQWREEEKRENLRRRLRNFDLEYFQHQEDLKRAEAAVKDKVPPKLAELEEAAAEQERAWKECLGRKEKERAEAARLKDLSDKLAGLSAESRELEKAYGVAAHLSEVANANTSGYQVSFQRYVLRALFLDVIEEANLRLSLMSQDRYRLKCRNTVRDGRSKGGLDLEIFDEYSGTARPAETLSGGESFLASLSLALGLADVVQSYAGGIRLDTMFIDEGFGTLDSETLDMALCSLLQLQQGGRLVGIISHVEELKQRIPVRLEVTKGRRGSSAEFVRQG